MSSNQIEFYQMVFLHFATGQPRKYLVAHAVNDWAKEENTAESRGSAFDPVDLRHYRINRAVAALAEAGLIEVQSDGGVILTPKGEQLIRQYPLEGWREWPDFIPT